MTTTFLATGNAHVTARARAALTSDRFDQAFAAGRQASFDEMARLILDQLATLETITPH